MSKGKTVQSQGEDGKPKFIRKIVSFGRKSSEKKTALQPRVDQSVENQVDLEPDFLPNPLRTFCWVADCDFTMVLLMCVNCKGGFLKKTDLIDHKAQYCYPLTTASKRALRAPDSPDFLPSSTKNFKWMASNDFKLIINMCQGCKCGFLVLSDLIAHKHGHCPSTGRMVPDNVPQATNAEDDGTNIEMVDEEDDDSDDDSDDDDSVDDDMACIDDDTDDDYVFKKKRAPKLNLLKLNLGKHKLAKKKDGKNAYELKHFAGQYDQIHRSDSEDVLDYRCLLCKRIYKTRPFIEASLGRHLFGHKAGLLTCKDCGYIATSVKCLSNHIERKHSDGVYTCAECGKEFSSKASLNSHRVNCLERKVMKCKKCDGVFTSSETLGEALLQLTQHMQEAHYGEGMVKCIKCDHLSLNGTADLMHRQNVHGTTRWECQNCGAMLKNKKGLEKHFKAIHLKEKHYTCPTSDCHFACFHKSQLEYHMKRNHGHTMEGDKQFDINDYSSVDCNKCGWKGIRISDLRRHLFLAHNIEVEADTIEITTPAPLADSQGVMAGTIEITTPAPLADSQGVMAGVIVSDQEQMLTIDITKAAEVIVATIEEEHSD